MESGTTCSALLTELAVKCDEVYRCLSDATAREARMDSGRTKSMAIVTHEADIWNFALCGLSDTWIMKMQVLTWKGAPAGINTDSPGFWTQSYEYMPWAVSRCRMSAAVRRKSRAWSPLLLPLDNKKEFIRCLWFGRKTFQCIPPLSRDLGVWSCQRLKYTTELTDVCRFVDQLVSAKLGVDTCIVTSAPGETLLLQANYGRTHYCHGHIAEHSTGPYWEHWGNQ